jgi:hypothetical protein
MTEWVDDKIDATKTAALTAADEKGRSNGRQCDEENSKEGPYRLPFK